MALNVEYGHQSKRVKVTSGTSMFEVLEAAREHFQLNASFQYQLLHRGRPIDLSIPFRLTGISNNAAVMLKELEGAGEVQQVRVCVQMRDGKRVQASFASNATIDYILAFFKLLPSPEQFSLGFLRREIGFDAFSTTTLKDLGVISGSAMFRVQNAEGQIPSQTPATGSMMSSQKHHVSFAAKSIPAAVSVGSTSAGTQNDASSRQTVDESLTESDMTSALPAHEDSSDGYSRMSAYDALQLVRDSNFDAVSRSTIITLMKIVSNVLSDPENEKIRSIRLSNPAFHRSVGQIKGGLEFLKALGFLVNPEMQTIVLDSGAIDRHTLEEGLKQLNVEADDLDIAADGRPVVREKTRDPNFDPFRMQITRVQMQPRGPSTTEILVDALKTKQQELVGNDKPPRNTTISIGGREWNNRTDFSSTSTVERESNDAQLLMSSLKARREGMEKAKNFRTQAMRELDELKRKKVFQTALIRVQFPDRAIMQATFHPTESIRDVMDHVAECLDASFRKSHFFLYVTPPMQKLAPEKTLAELNLVPAALTYLSWVGPAPSTDASLDGSSIGFYLRADAVMDNHAESKESVDSNKRVEYPKPLHLDPTLAEKPQPHPVSEMKRHSTAQDKSAKKPSWLKL